MKKFEFYIPTSVINKDNDFHSYFMEYLSDPILMRRITARKIGSRIESIIGNSCIKDGAECPFFYGFDADSNKSYCCAHKDEDICVPIQSKKVLDQGYNE